MDHSKSTLEEIFKHVTKFLKPGAGEATIVMVSVSRTAEDKVRIRIPAVVYEKPGEFELEGNLCLPVVDRERVIR